MRIGALAYQVPEVQPDFQFGVNIVKSMIDEGGDYIVEGVASATTWDEQDDLIESKGLQFDYLLKHGWIKWEHGKSPNVFIGKALVAKVIQTEKGPAFYLKAKLLKGHPLVEELWDQLELLKKSDLGRLFGFSIEGQALKRDPRNTKRILKAIVRNVAITANPVNTDTWVDIAKSLAFDSPDALVFEADGWTDKSMTTDTGSAVRVESVEHSEKENAGVYRALIDLLRGVKTGNLPDRDVFVTRLMEAGATAEFADSLADRYHGRAARMAKSFAGGESVTKKFQESLDELEKSLEALESSDNSVDEEVVIDDHQIEKAIDDEPVDEDDENADEEPGDEEPGDEDDIERSFNADDDQQVIEKAVEVSPFLAALVRKQETALKRFEKKFEKALSGAGSGSLAKSFRALGGMSSALNEALEEQNELVKSLAAKVESLQTEVSSLGLLPSARRSAVSSRDIQQPNGSGTPSSAEGLISKGFGIFETSSGQRFSKTDIVDKLVKGLESGAISDGSVITSFEVTNRLDPVVFQKVKDL